MHLTSLKWVGVLTGVLIVLYTSAGAAGAMEISVITSRAKTVVVQTDAEDTIEDVKTFVFNVTNQHVANQIMKKDGKVLENSRTLASCGISEGDTLYVYEGIDTTYEAKGKNSGPGFYFYVLIGVVVVIYLLTRKKPTRHHPR